MSEILTTAIQKVLQSEAAFCRFITGNDTGTTGSHQAGFYIPKCASSLLFDQPGQKGENLSKIVRIKWQDDFYTESCMKYYGQGTRNEYRITRFGRGFPFFQDENIGDLLVICRDSEEYNGFVLKSDDDIEDFFAYFNLSWEQTNQLIDVSGIMQPDAKLSSLFADFVSQFDSFPETRQMSVGARECYNKAYGIHSGSLSRPDDVLLAWIDTEFKLFKCMEEKVYSSVISQPFDSIDSFIKLANEVLNRRKSRAGKSLEHHLADIFTRENIKFQAQARTEDNKRPDFLFPNEECYHNLLFPTEDLVVLGVKTTCKDRWRQVLTEADRVDGKYLFTLQQGISRNQLKEMKDSQLTLVVPHKYIPSFPADYQQDISDLFTFMSMVKEKQSHSSKSFYLG